MNTATGKLPERHRLDANPNLQEHFSIMLSGTATDRLAEYFTLKTPVWHSYRLRCKLIGNSSVSKVSLPSDRALVPDYTPIDGGPVKGQEFCSVQDGIKALGKPMICAPARLSEVSPTLPFKQFQCLSD